MLWWAAKSLRRRLQGQVQWRTKSAGQALVAAVGDVGWFKWRDLTDEDAVLTQEVGLNAGVLAGDVGSGRPSRRVAVRSACQMAD